MTRLSQLVDMSALQAADDDLAKIGIAATCVPLVEKYDFDPDYLVSTLETVNSIVDEVRAAAGALTEPIGGDDCWEGQGRDQADEYRKCVASWWQEILDFLLGIVDWLIQILDWIVEFLHFIAGWIVWLAGWITAFLPVGGFLLPSVRSQPCQRSRRRLHLWSVRSVLPHWYSRLLQSCSNIYSTGSSISSVRRAIRSAAVTSSRGHPTMTRSRRYRRGLPKESS